MVVGGFPWLALLLAPPRRMADEIHPTVDIGRRYARLGEIELVGSVEVTPIRQGIADHHALLHPGQRAEVLIQVRLSQADHRDVSGPAENIQPVDVDLRSHLAGRYR